VTRRVLYAVALAAAAAALAGCGGGGGSSSAAPAPAPREAEELLTAKDVSRYPEGSPARAVLAWWRRAQFADRIGVERAFTKSIRERLHEAGNERLAVEFFAAVIRPARPKILDVERDGPTAVVYTQIQYVSSSAPRAFRLVREKERWVLDDDSYMQSVLPQNLRRSST
jgi:hypothetical protein